MFTNWFKHNDDDMLYVILPYFNFCKFDNRRRLLLEFVARNRHTAGIRIVVSEGKLSGDKYDLPDEIKGVYRHYRFNYPHALWIKENLVNLAVKQLPDNWKYMAWIDADLTFVNDNWVKETKHALRKFDVIQLFETCVNLGPGGDAEDKPERSFGYMHTNSKHPYHPKAKYGFWHPGYAWAIARKPYEKISGLIDFAVLGSGDRHMALALIGKVEWSAPGNIHDGYHIRLRAFQDRCKGLKLGYISGTIVHHWHGNKADRKYVQRWDILTKGTYNPQIDIKKTKEGLLHLTNEGLRLQHPIIEYFKGRNEDGKGYPKN